jgi:uncharacterized membrane protein
MPGEVRHPWREAVRSLWFLPSVFIVAALASGYGLSRIEISDGGRFESLIFQGSPSAARELLTVVSGTMITVTGLVFVLTVVALQIASTQFSPRLLRSFLQDPGTRLVLSVFVATFAYSLGGLFTVGQVGDDGVAFVPRLAVTGSLILALLSVGMLVYYIQHITNSIRIDTVMLGIRRVTAQAIRREFARPVPTPSRGVSEPPVPEANALTITSDKSGYVQEIDVEALAAIARSVDGTLRLRVQTGHHVVAGTPLGWVWPAPVTGQMTLNTAINGAVVRAHERTVDHDVGFGIRQLVDVALRAIAPSVNDPYTAVQAIQHLAVLFVDLALVSTDDHQVWDEDLLRLYVPVPGFELFLDLVCSNLRGTAADRPRVMVELLRLLETVSVVGTCEARRHEIARQVEIVVSDCERRIGLESDFAWVRTLADRARYAAQTGSVAPS